MKFTKKIIKVVIAAILLGLVFSGFEMFADHNYSTGIYSAIDAANAAEKIKNAQKSGGTVTLDNDEINELIQVYLKKGLSFGNFTIKEANAALSENEITVYVPSKFKGISFLVTSKGGLSYNQDGKILFTPDYFKVGKLTIPKQIVFYMIKKLGNTKLSVADNSIEIDKKIVPFAFDELQIKNGSASLYVEKFILKGLFEDKITVLNNAKEELQKLQTDTQNSAAKEKIQNVISEIDNAVKNPDSATEKVVDKINSDLSKVAEAAAEQGSNKAVTDIQDQIKTTDEDKKKQDLLKASSELNAAAAMLKTPAQKSIISMMQSTIGKLVENPSYNFRSDAAVVKSLYGKLPLNEKKALKAALLSSVDPSTVMDLRNAFGL